MMKNFYQKGITIIELLIVIVVIGIMALIVLPQFSYIKENQVLKNGVSDILSSIDKARGQTLSSLNSSEYGVHFESDKVIIFKGTVFSAIAPDNENIYFNRLSGSPSVTGTVTLSTTNYSKIITISATVVGSSN